LLTKSQTVQLAAQIITWAQWCASEDNTFNLSDFEIQVYQRPSGVADLFYKTPDHTGWSNPAFHLGYVYSNGVWVETSDQEMPNSYWENVTAVDFT